MQVALRMKAKGGTPRAGDVIPYLFCLGEGEEPAKSAQADRAKHPDEVRRAGSALKIGEFNHLTYSGYKIDAQHQILNTTWLIRFSHPLNGCVSLSRAQIGLDWRSVLV